MPAQQMALLGRGAPSIDPMLDRLRRVQLDESAWVDYAPDWISGHDQLMAELVHGTRWHREQREMYERMVDVPRLVASLPADGPVPPLIERVRRLLSARYGVELEHITLGYYRDGSDSVAWHGDYVARNLDEALVATVSLGAPRRFLLRPVDGGRSIAFTLGWGDLIVMGGACQRTWQHAIPKVARADPRIAVMLRPSWYRGWDRSSKRTSRETPDGAGVEPGAAALRPAR
jgi:alkylated DNA repair dioxygenase AlkB